jgi:F-type H+-transporting ATPase subunit gamma
MMDVQSQIVKALFESCVAEHSARMFNMSKATDNAEVLLKRLRILYNQMRQASITNEIIEISAGYKNT